MNKDTVKLTFLGTGTSQGVPIIGCNCEVCTSTDRHDKRLRSSALVEYNGLKIVVDAGPDFRYQMLRQGIRDVDGILLTHNHKDHTGGLDDVRAFNYINRRPTDIYCEQYVEKSLEGEYSYVFADNKYPGIPEWNVHIIDNQPFTIISPSPAGKPDDGTMAGSDTTGGNPGNHRPSATIIPIRGMHYKLPVLGFRFGGIAYCTDMNFIPDAEFAKLTDLDHFIINCVRRGKHISHFSLEEALEVSARVGAKHTWLTHLSHQLPRYKDLCCFLPPTVLPAYDGLVITA